MTLALYHDVYRCTDIKDAEDAPELIVIHGWGLHSVVWDNVMPVLLSHFQVTVVDLPGLGRSPIPSGDYDLEYLTEQVLAIAPAEAVWMGWSLGGMIAMNAAAKYPERVSGLITVASTPQFVADKHWPLALNAEVLSQFQALLAEDWEGTLVRFLALQCKDSSTIKEDIRFLKEIVFFHGHPSTKALRCGLEVLAGVHLVDKLVQIKAPTLHILGEMDNLIPVGISRSLKESQPDAQIAVIKGASHVPFISDPSTFLSAVTDFVTEQNLA